jgi:hypothetical protein
MWNSSFGGVDFTEFRASPNDGIGIFFVHKLMTPNVVFIHDLMMLDTCVIHGMMMPTSGVSRGRTVP